MKITMFPHETTLNHGCEAIIITTCNILNLERKNIFLISNRYEDKPYTTLLKNFCSIKYINRNEIKRFSRKWFARRLGRIFLTSTYLSFLSVKKNFQLMPKADIYMSIGGDNYCYGEIDDLYGLDYCIKKARNKLVLWGASIESSKLNNDKIKDLNSFDLIITRESLSYNTLKIKTTVKNIFLYPDPAFTLKGVNCHLPINFKVNNTIGINVSPLILNYEKVHGATMKNYKELLQHIIKTSNMQIALIPHVCINTSDDRVPLAELYNEFKDTDRVVMIEEHNCMEIKGFISQCKMFIGARTHATIAAYSTCIPTLVVGYSVKAKGIAKDIFGTYENYVIPVQTLENKDDLINAFEWLKKNEKKIKKHLEEFMPEYIKKAWHAGDEIRKLMEMIN